MKKIISFALALTLSFCLCGCNDNGGSGRLPSPLDGVVAPDNTPKVETTEYLMVSKSTGSRSKNPTLISIARVLRSLPIPPRVS